MLAYQVFLKENPDGSGVLSRAGYSNFALASAAIDPGVHCRIVAMASRTHPVPEGRARAQGDDRRGGPARSSATLNNRSFIALTAAGIFCFIALGARGGLEIYFNIYFWGLRQSQCSPS